MNPITEAIARLFNASGWSYEQWAPFFNCAPEQIAQWCGEGEVTCPTDAQMTQLVHDLEWRKGSAGWPEMPAALDHFWATIAAWEKDPGESSILFPLREGETTVMRVVRFTNDGHLEGIFQMMFLVPPRRRREFLDEMTVVFNKYTDDTKPDKG